MPHPVDVHVGTRLREARNLQGLSQMQLGEMLGISFQQVQKYEKGANRIGSSRLFDIAGHLNMPVAYFFDGLDGTSPVETPLSRRALALARQLEEIPNPEVKKQILALVKACSNDN